MYKIVGRKINKCRCTIFQRESKILKYILFPLKYSTSTFICLTSYILYKGIYLLHESYNLNII